MRSSVAASLTVRVVRLRNARMFRKARSLELHLELRAGRGHSRAHPDSLFETRTPLVAPPGCACRPPGVSERRTARTGISRLRGLSRGIE
jgi:hypothetical protein